MTNPPDDLAGTWKIPAGADDARHLLRTRGLWQMTQRAGYVPALTQATLPVMSVPQAEITTPCSEAMLDFLYVILAGHHPDLLMEWLLTVALHDRHIPAEHLINLVNLTEQPDLDWRSALLIAYLTGHQMTWLREQGAIKDEHIVITPPSRYSVNQLSQPDHHMENRALISLRDQNWHYGMSILQSSNSPWSPEFTSKMFDSLSQLITETIMPVPPIVLPALCVCRVPVNMLDRLREIFDMNCHPNLHDPVEDALVLIDFRQRMLQTIQES